MATASASHSPTNRAGPGRQLDEREVEHAAGESWARAATADLGRDVREYVCAGEAAEGSVCEGYHRVEVGTRHRPEGHDEGHEPSAVAAALSNSCRPVSCGDSRWAAIPEPMTMEARNAESKDSANARRHSTGRRGGRGPVAATVAQQRRLTSAPGVTEQHAPASPGSTVRSWPASISTCSRMV